MIAKDGYSTIRNAIILGVLATIIAYLVHFIAFIVVAALSVFLLLFMLYFFRNPVRTIPTDDQLIISPADGKVIVLEKVEYNKYLKGPGTQLSVFLSPIDVHVNRIPMSGIIEYAEYFPGKYLVAWHEKASELNERSEFGVKHQSGLKVYFNQITGYLARRITYSIKEGDQVEKGYLFGMMKFGSRMDIVIPDHIEIEITQGQRVVGGETILAKIPKSA